MSETEKDLKLESGNWGIVAVALLLPTIVTWIYFVQLADRSPGVQQSVYLFGKTIQFALPVVWIILIRRRKLQLALPSSSGLRLGFAFGLLIAAAMFLLYHIWLQPSGFFDGPGKAVRDKIGGLGLGSPTRYFTLGVFYAALHSLLEEYYWRWFVFRELRRLVPLGTAITVSSLGFMAHHVILLAVYFGWSSPATYFFSLSVAVGGAIWAWLYHRTGSLYGPWLSHSLVDAAIFIIGYDLASDLMV